MLTRNISSKRLINNKHHNMKIYVKNMVCNRCIFVVEEQLKILAIPVSSVTLGEVDFGNYNLDTRQYEKLKDLLGSFGFEILDNKTSQLVGKVKSLLIGYVQHELNEPNKLNISEYLKNKLHYDYNYLSNLFSSISGFTIEHYIIQLKIEKVKELLFYNELTLSEIAFEMGYSSVAHLSNQFKKETGLTPSYFKKLKDVRKRQSLDKL